MMSPGQDPVRQAITKEFFQIVAENSNEYELFLSRVTFEELEAAKTEEKRKTSADFLETIQFTELPENDEAENLARIYTIDGVMSQARMEDLRHVAYAVVARCDYIITWNMRHLANAKTEMRVNRVNSIENYTKITIVNPEHFTKGESYGQR
jgi:predicted nucleic acid-binding protein